MDFAPRINIFLSWDSYALIYYLLGGFLGKYKERCAATWNNKISIILGGASILGLWGYGRIFMNVNHSYYDIIIGAYPCILLFIGSGLVVAFTLMKEIKVHIYLKKIITECSKNSMGIYFIHLLIGTMLKPFYITLEFYDTFIASIMYASVVWLLSFFISMLLYRIPIAKKLISL